MLDNPKLRLAAGLAWACMESCALKEALGFKLQEQYVRGVPRELTLTNCVRGPELAGKKTLVISKSTLMVCGMLRGHLRETHQK